MAAFPFLALPRELRDRIYLLVLRSPLHTPVVSNIFESVTKLRKQEHPISEPIKSHSLRGKNDASSPYGSASLRASNRQISREVKETIEWMNRSSEDGIAYVLDLEAYEKMSLRPTWLALPAPVEYVKTVRLEFRVAESVEFNPISGGSDGGPGLFTQRLLQLLASFVMYGPRLTHVPRREGRQWWSDDEATTSSWTVVPAVFHVACLFINLKFEGVDLGAKGEEGRAIDPDDVSYGRRILGVLAARSRQVARSGLLYGKLDCIIVGNGDSFQKITVEDRSPEEKAATEEEWAHIGWVPGKLDGNA